MSGTLKSPTGVFDNQRTMRREWWSDGKFNASASATLIEQPHYLPASVARSLLAHRRWGHFPDLPAVHPQIEDGRPAPAP